ncbi:glycoside hydrolase family 55 protein [Azospirillum doebereinerae]|uniref:glycoside hydrolase family 55 protein n=1 Tax=Azospirillum doebereinerae TaxID=92933 RepID=UPI001EE50701|nr:glycoside hydrolase family 55 protein [Azospirillum doebereinerae]MCG5241410.1 glycoside hydrolase family 55 protein [Azospirillum doebereinerae]
MSLLPLTRVATSMIALTALGPGGFSIDLESKLYETVSVKDFGAKGNGTADDTAAIQAALDWAKGKGATIHVPRGDYKIMNTLVIDESTTTNENINRISIVGSGMDHTVFRWAGSATGTMIEYKGPEYGAGGIHSYSRITDIAFISRADWNEEGTVITKYYGIAFSAKNMAYFRMDNIRTQLFETAFRLEDFLSSTFTNIIARGLGKGVIGYRNFTAGNPDDYQTGPNNLTFIGCTFSGCRDYALNLNSGSTLTYIGGSIENNGLIASGAEGYRYGVRIENSGVEGGIGCTFVGTYFEHNMGDADVVIEQGDPTGNPALPPRGFGSGYTFLGCTFNRAFNDQKTDFNIRFNTGTLSGALTVIGCGFLGAGSYEPSDTRPCIQLPTNSAARTWKAIQEGNWFSHPNIDAPPWSKTQTFTVLMDNDQTVPNATPTLVNFRKVATAGNVIGEDYGNNWRDDLRGWTAPFDIRMSFAVKVQYTGSLVAGNYAVLELRVNNAVTRTYPLVSNGGGALLINCDLNLKKNDLVQVVTTHSAGADRTIFSGPDATYFTGHPI